jgi:uncharacterized membrane protein YjjP (DUF1212 family)
MSQPKPPSPSPDLLARIADAGAALLAAGGEVARVEDTMDRLAQAFGLRAEAVVLPTVLLVSTDEGRTVLRRIRRRGTNLGAVAALNALSRDVVAGRVPPEAFGARLDAVTTFQRYPARGQLLAAGVAAALLSLLFDGRVPDLPWALAAGVLAQAVRVATRRTPFHGSLGDFLAACAASLPALGAAGLGVANPGAVVAGGIMVLVPGLLLTTAVRDGLSGDLLSAAARLLEAGLTAGAVAAGVALPLYVYLQAGGRWP